MKKIFAKLTLILAAAVAVASCGKFEVGETETVNLAGNWYCTVHYSNGESWVAYQDFELQTFNTAKNVGTEMWIDDFEGFWGTRCKIDCSNSKRTFGKEGIEYFDTYNEVKQMIWGGKVTKNGAVAPKSGTICDKIEFFIAFADDETPYEYAYYVVGYRRTGFPEEDETCVEEWASYPDPTITVPEVIGESPLNPAEPEGDGE